MVILVLYVGVIIVTRNDVDEIPKLKNFLSREFEIKDLGLLKYFLGIEVARSKTEIIITQKKYVLDLLEETERLSAKPVDTPIEQQNHSLHLKKWRSALRQENVSEIGRKANLSYNHKT